MQRTPPPLPRRTIGPNDDYNRAAWTAFLSAHGFNINTVYRVDVDPDTITVHRFATDAKGNPYPDPAAPTQAATMPPRTVPLKLPVPK